MLNIYREQINEHFKPQEKVIKKKKRADSSESVSSVRSSDSELNLNILLNQTYDRNESIVSHRNKFLDGNLDANGVEIRLSKIYSASS